ncbi:phage holin [Enterococcus olivae]
MILKDKHYQFIKWFVLLFMPALSTLIGLLGKAYGFENTELVVLTINGVTVFLGAITGVSQINYNKKDGE